MAGSDAAALAASYELAWALPFVGWLLTMGLAPLVAPRLWQAHYGKLAALWAAAFLLPDAFFHGARAMLAGLFATAVEQYLPFALLLGAFFVIAGGLRLTGTPRGTPGVNTALLAIGVLLASVIGTVGAALLMVRPLVRANRHRGAATHVFVFFIFLVANLGGALTPLGNPPLLLGYLKGVPFFWPAVHLALPTAVLAGGLLATFYALDRFLHRRRRAAPSVLAEPVLAEIERLGIEGAINLPLLALAILALMLRLWWPSGAGITLVGVTWPYEAMATDGLLIVAGLLSLRLTRPAIRRANDFAWAPLAEVAIVFAAIFITLIPVTAMLTAGRDGPLAPLIAHLWQNGAPDNPLFYRATGVLSALLDNAPTYLMVFGVAGNDAAHLTGPLASTLAAISAGAVYFGGLTYIGNSPNLMVKAIVESQGLRMPSFFGYVGWGLICLLPWLLVVEAIFFH